MAFKAANSGFSFRALAEMTENPNKTILIVEDNEDDVFAMKRSLRRAGILNPVQIVTDGQEAMDYLAGEGRFANRDSFPIPFIAFLDLKLPFVRGFEVLEWVRRQPSLRQLAVVVLTSSPESRDYERAYALGARSYVVKPPTAEMLREVMISLGSLWLASSQSMPVSMPPNLTGPPYPGS
jgi:CheY-like chemotaxis protein